MKQLAIGIGWFLFGAAILMGWPLRPSAVKPPDHVAIGATHAPEQPHAEFFVPGNDYPVSHQAVPEVSDPPPPPPRRVPVLRVHHTVAHGHTPRPRHQFRRDGAHSMGSAETPQRQSAQLGSPVSQLRAEAIQTP